MIGSIFSESWYRVAELQVGLLYTVKVHKQFFRSAEWYVLHEPFNNRFFRLRPEAWDFIGRLKPSVTVGEVWEECLQNNPDNTPNQDDVIHLLSQLHHSNMLYFKNAPQVEAFFERYRKIKQKEWGGQLMSILFLKIPLWDPDLFLRRVNIIISLIFSKGGFLVWMGVILAGLFHVLGNLPALMNNTQGVLAPSNLFLLYISMILLKIFHELTHAGMTRRFGGEVHTMGIMLLVLTPLPYMDASASWAFRNKWQRVLVGAAGVMSDLFMASIAAMVWSYSGHEVVSSLAFNMLFIGSVSSLLFNGNPLTRLDAYYILSDLLEIPNLSMSSRNQWFGLGKKYLFGVKNVDLPAESPVEGFWLLLYGLLSFAYRVFISVGITIFVMDKIFLLGIMAGIISLYMWFLGPLYRFFKYLFLDPALELTRKRAIAVSGLALLPLLFMLFFQPFPSSIRAPGIVFTEGYARTYTGVAGFLRRIHVKSGQAVSRGDLLLSLENPELEMDLRMTRAQIAESEALLLRARREAIADLQPIEERLAFLNSKLAYMEEKLQKTAVRAAVDGVWVSPELENRLNNWLSENFMVGSVVPSGGVQFVAVVGQEQAAELFGMELPAPELKLAGLENLIFKTSELQIIPYEKRELPSAALGWFGGGRIPVSRQDGKTTLESFFEVRAPVAIEALTEKERAAFLHGRTGWLRMELPPESLLEQVIRTVKQVMQKRYGM
jgi:putative peptide zinc metalloprotease protein